MVVVNGRRIYFGQLPYGHYKDRTGIWDDLDHEDEKRRDAFRRRFEGMKLKDGTRAIDNPESPAYHSYRILW